VAAPPDGAQVPLLAVGAETVTPPAIGFVAVQDEVTVCVPSTGITGGSQVLST
jgi:hypothetical protein